MTFKNDTAPCLKLGVASWFPFTLISVTGPPYKVTGAIAQVMEIVAHKLNFCIEYVVPEDKLFGSQLPNSSWTGLMGQLTRGEVDMTGVVMSLSDERNQAIDFSVPLYMDASKLAYKRPVLESDITGFVKPYTNRMWMLLVLTVVGVLVATFTLIQCRHRLLSRPRSRSINESDSWGVLAGEIRHSDNTVTNAWWTSNVWILTTLLAQALPRWPQGDSLRVMTGVWLLMAFIVGTVYRSNLKAMLILPRLKLPFNNLEELVDTDIPCFVNLGTALYRYVETAKPGSTLYKLKRQAVIHTNLPLAVKNLLVGTEAAFSTENGILFIIHSHFAQTKTCPLYLTDETFYTTSVSLAFPKGSNLRQKIDPIVQNLNQFGILNRLLMNGVRHARECLKSGSSAKQNNSLRPLELGDFYGVFSVYAGGILLAGIVFLLEQIRRTQPRTASHELH
ncbi:glutamate receptor 1-like [Homarus americanus]|uniref:glutamate receptor 1-like n=1 Tax=Homarus americanus TaxID=6706 RepID=UPI001C44FBEA|nr:glutamate receptor 1-like [Homarus americanus]